MKKLKILLLCTFILCLFKEVPVYARENFSVKYQVHIQDIGWQDWRKDNETAGTTGKVKRLEAIKINLENQLYSGDIEYQTHIQDIGWQNWRKGNEVAGTTGQAKRIEAIKIRLTGEIETKYDIYYRLHSQDYGWLDWAKNGDTAGTIGLSKQAEAIEIILVKKGEAAPGSTGTSHIQRYVSYQGHVQDIGWQNKVYDGQLSGTQGRAKQLEAIKINLENQLYNGNIEYQAHIQDIGWQDWKKNNEIAGTTGQVKRLEAVRIRLTDEMEAKYDIYYRCHVENYGWLGWTKNGLPSGTEGYSYRLEALEVRLVKKGEAAPGEMENSYYNHDNWLNNLNVAKNCSQLIIVSVTNGNYANVSMNTKLTNGTWVNNFSTGGRVGRNGINKISEGDKKTPTGVYTLGQAFGVGNNPGTTRNWLKINSNHYWVDDSNSSHYNKLVDSSITGIQWQSAEHLIDYPIAYKYAIAIDYNLDCIPGKGSAVFLHCSTGNATAGCISIPEGDMIKTLKELKDDCKIIIDYSYNIYKY